MMWRLARAASVAALGLLSACGGGEKPRIEGKGAEAVMVEALSIAGRDEGVSLHLLNKRPVEWTQSRPERTVLFVHGATFPGSATFDLQLDGTSWMDWLARRGYDVYVLDIRGYGRSSRPPEMAAPADSAAPVVTTQAALRDVSKAVDVILSRTGLPRLVLVGWSWGATLAGQHAEIAGNQIDRLVLLSPQWLRDAPTGDLGRIGAWRAVRLDQARERWLRDVPEAKRKALVAEGWLDAWTEAMKRADPEGAREDPPVLRVPNGAVEDTLKSWATATPMWRPERVHVPTMVVQGEWDAETPPTVGSALAARLTGTPHRRYEVIREGTHSVMMESSREQLFRVVQKFLEERF